MFVDFNILNQLGSPSINSNIFANRPAAGQTGRLFVSTDTFEIYRDNGTTWDLIGGPGSSTITGSGTVGTIPLWTSTSAIGDSDLRQLSSQALILNSATNDWPTSQIVNDAGRILLTSVTNNPTLICWGKNAFGSGDEQGTIVLGNVTALGTTTIGGAFIDGFIENNTDGAGSFQIRTTNTSGNPATALTINSSQISTFTNNVIVNSPGSIGIRTATPGAALDIHSTGTIAQFNTTAATGNVFLAIQRSGTGLWRIGDTYNGGNNFFELHNTVLTSNAIEVVAASNEATFVSSKTYSSGNAIGVAVRHNLTIPNGTNVGLAALGGVNSNLNLSLGGNTTVAATGRQGLEGSTSISFTGAGTLTMTQGSTVRAFSALSSVYAFNGSAVGTITHLAGLRICFPDNVGSAVNITNNYALLINNQTTGTGTVTYTNRWGIYQEGASDLNYMAANLLLGSTVNTGEKLQVTGTAIISSSISAASFIPTSATIPTNGMFLPSANTLAFATNTAQRITVSSTGSVGIGNNSPVSLLSLAGAFAKSLSNEDTWHLQIRDTTAMTTGVGGGIVLTGNYTTGGSGASFAAINSYKENATSSNGAAQLRFYTADAFSILNLSALFTSTGNFLIGTTTDTGQKLQVNGDIKIGYTKTASGNTGSINNATATTMFAITGSLGLWLVACNLPAGNGSPTLYTAFATIVVDGNTTPRIVSNDGTLLTITLSGTNVQVTQTSGGTQAGGVDWVYQKIG